LPFFLMIFSYYCRRMHDPACICLTTTTPRTAHTICCLFFSSISRRGQPKSPARASGHGNAAGDRDHVTLVGTSCMSWLQVVLKPSHLLCFSSLLKTSSSFSQARHFLYRPLFILVISTAIVYLSVFPIRLRVSSWWHGASIALVTPPQSQRIVTVLEISISSMTFLCRV
jgi:hypothetical protein